MKTVLTIFTLLFTVMIPSISFAEWTRVTDNDEGDVYYVDFERIREHNGYVYFWRLRDHLKPNYWGELSASIYYQGDCQRFRTSLLSGVFYKEPMGGGVGETKKPTEDDKDWYYPTPDSENETILKEVCKH